MYPRTHQHLKVMRISCCPLTLGYDYPRMLSRHVPSEWNVSYATAKPCKVTWTFKAANSYVVIIISAKRSATQGLLECSSTPLWEPQILQFHHRRHDINLRLYSTPVPSHCGLEHQTTNVYSLLNLSCVPESWELTRFLRHKLCFCHSIVSWNIVGTLFHMKCDYVLVTPISGRCSVTVLKWELIEFIKLLLVTGTLSAHNCILVHTTVKSIKKLYIFFFYWHYNPLWVL